MVLDNIDVITPTKDHRVILLWESSHYAVLEVHISERTMMISDGLDYALLTWYRHAEYVLKKIGAIKARTNVNFIDHQGEATLLINDTPVWHLKSQDFLTQGDGHNCGPIACLKFMKVFNVTTKKKVMASKLTLQEMVMQQYKTMIDAMKFDLVILQKTSMKDIVKSSQLVCICLDYKDINNKATRFMSCCGYNFHLPCISSVIEECGSCPSCCAETPKSSNKRLTDTTREESAAKKKSFQICQGQKMVDLYSTCIKDAVGDVTVGSIVTLQVDRCVASHPCGVLAIVVDHKDTGGIIACSSSGIIVNGKQKCNWWIPSDQYKLIGTDLHQLHCHRICS